VAPGAACGDKQAFLDHGGWGILHEGTAQNYQAGRRQSPSV
jgi:hypothetical protein